MNGDEKSDEAVVPEKRANNAAEAVAEHVEERASAKRNTDEFTAARAQNRSTASRDLNSVRKAARMHRDERFTSLLHYVDVDRLRESFYSLKRKSAAGSDGLRWMDYQEGLEERLVDLHSRIHSGRYHAKPARRTTIPKADGGERKLSIWCLEDKIVQQAIVTVLNAVYEEDFLGFSYGFRQGKGQHDALDALSTGIIRRRVNWVLDADIQSFFDQIDHDWMMRFMEHRIADKRVLRLIRKWLKVGVLDEDGNRLPSDLGAAQGAVISPLLANIYLHYVFDLWSLSWRKGRATGDMIIIRYADDVVLGFESKSDANRYRAELDKRLAKFALNLHPKKTKLIRFGRWAMRDSKRFYGVKPATFDFLGFTHYCTVARANGQFAVGRKTIKGRMVATLHIIKSELRRRMHRPISETGRWLTRVLTGHLNYFSVPGNYKSLAYFFIRVERLWLRSLRRRSQRNIMTWARFHRIKMIFFPPIKVLHPYPKARFDAKTQGRSPVR